MTEEEKKAIEYLNGYKYQNEVSEAINIVLNLIQNQQSELEKKDKMIDEISKNPYNELRVNGILFTGKDIKQYFERKVKQC